MRHPTETNVGIKEARYNETQAEECSDLRNIGLIWTGNSFRRAWQVTARSDAAKKWHMEATAIIG